MKLLQTLSPPKKVGEEIVKKEMKKMLITFQVSIFLTFGHI